jgi:hypothetical protein
MIYIDRFRISTSSALHGTNHEKNPEEACSSKVESEKGSNEEKIDEYCLSLQFPQRLILIVPEEPLERYINLT